MVKINYFDGKKYIEVEVSDELAKAYADISQEEKREHWREDKRELEDSLDEMLELGNEAAGGADILEDYIGKEELDKLEKAKSQLLPSQQELLRKIYFEGKKQAEIAKEIGVKKTAINNQLKRILEKLKKFFD